MSSTGELHRKSLQCFQTVIICSPSLLFFCFRVVFVDCLEKLVIGTISVFLSTADTSENIVFVGSDALN